MCIEVQIVHEQMMIMKCCAVSSKVVQQLKQDIIIVGDFNFLEINWDFKHLKF